MTPTSDPQTCQVATVGTGRGGGGRSRQIGRGGGQKTENPRRKGLVPQSEIDPNHMTRDKTVPWSLETLRTIRIDQRRTVSTVNDVSYTIHDQTYETTLGLDSHADTCVLGRDALIILDYQRLVNVVGYDESLGTKTYDPSAQRPMTLTLTRGTDKEPDL
jgi:hypothetical protein